MPNLFRRSFDVGWFADADAENAPPGTLLRADNVVLDSTGALSLRPGSQLIPGHSVLGIGGAHTVQSFEIDGRPYVFAGVGKRAFRNAVDFGVDFDGHGDMAMGTDSYQVFVARGKTGMKYDGLTANRWGIPAPQIAPTLSSATAVATEFATFASGEADGGFVVTEGAKAFITGWDAASNGATELTVNPVTGRASAYKRWAADQNFLDVLGTVGGDTDLFDMFTALSEVSKCVSVTVMFGLGPAGAADPFVNDYYSFDFNIKDGVLVDVKDAKSAAPSVYRAAATSSTQTLSPKDITDVKTPQEVVAVLARLGRTKGPISRERADAAQSSPAWSHFAVTRGQFIRVGQTSGRDWSTVTGFKVVVQYLAGSAYTADFDSTIWYAGGARALTGVFRVGYRYARNFKQYVELSPFSPVSLPITLNQQGLNVFIPAAAITSMDPQCDALWIYFYSDFIGAYYRVMTLAASPSSSTMSIDEFDPTGDASIDAADRTRLNQFGMTIPGFQPNLDLTIVVQKSEIEALRENVRLEPGAGGPPDNIIAIAGPLYSRMFALTDEGWVYVSSQKTPSSFSVYHAIDLRRWGVPKWMKLTTGGLHVGLSGDVVRIAGTGGENEDHSRVDLYADPLNVANPPVDATIYGDGNTLIYRAADGLWSLAGLTAVPVSSQGTSQLWRGIARHGVNPLDTRYGRFRLAIDNQLLYMLAPEGGGYLPPADTAIPIDWQSLSGLSSSGSTLTKTASSGFGNTSATAKRLLASGNGYVETTVVDGGAVVMRRFFGLSHCDSGIANDSGGDSAKIDFAFSIDGLTRLVSVYEDGVAINVATASFPLVAGTVLRVEIFEGRVYYKKDGVIVYASGVVPNYPLAFDSAFNEQGSTLDGIVISGNWELVNASTPAVWRYELGGGHWSRFVYPTELLSLYRGHDGRVLAGDADGSVWELDVGTQDDGQPIAVNILTPIDSDNAPLRAKSPLDLQVNADTAGDVAALLAYVDGADAPSTTLQFAGSGGAVHRQSASVIGDFSRLQIGITGSFSRFTFRGLNVSYRDHPQQVMEIDTGYLMAPGGGERAYIGRVEVCCKSPVDLEIIPTFDDVAMDAITLPVSPNKTSVYSTLLRRGQDSGRRPLLRIRTTNPAGQGNVGFEPYWVRIHFSGTGNRSQKSVTINYGSIAGGSAQGVGSIAPTGAVMPQVVL